MGVRIERLEKDGGRWIVCGNSQEELQTGIQALRIALDGNSTKGRRGRPPKNGVARSTEKEQARLRTALVILRAINEAGKSGANGSSLSGAAGIDEGRALGPIMGMVVRVLRASELVRKDVYVTRGFGDKKRWIAQTTMNEAIKKLEEKEMSNSL
jgi:hypothetical protein